MSVETMPRGIDNRETVREGASKKVRKLKEAAEQATLAFGQLINFSPICLIRGPDKGKMAYYREADGTIFMLQERSSREGRAVHAVNVEKHVLERYALRGEITQAQFASGDELRQRFDRAGFFRFVGLRYDGVRSGSTRYEFTGSQMEAMLDVAGILSGMSRVSEEFLRRVCCYGEWAADVAESRGASRRYGIERLREALDELTEYLEKRKRRAAATRPAVQVWQA